jgi:hypothetical protein
VQQTLATGSVFQSLQLSFMAVRRLTRLGAWRLPNDYLSLLNRLRYGLRLMLLGGLHCEWLHVSKNKLRTSNKAALAATALLMQLREKWLCCESLPPTLSSAISRIFFYIKLVMHYYRPQGQVVWDCALQLVCYRSVQLRMTQWHNFAAHLIDSCLHTLHNKLLLSLPGTERFPRTHQLCKDWFNKQPGTNFLDNLANASLLAPWQNWLLAHIGMHAATSALTHTNNNNNGNNNDDDDEPR